jgi:hypothetical protein
MLAWDTARTWWQNHSTVPFEERLGWHLSCGLVYSTPSAFLLASEVCWNGIEILHGAPNAWFVEFSVILPPSSLASTLRAFPHSHKWLLWRRNFGPRIHAWAWDRFESRVNKQPTI